MNEKQQTHYVGDDCEGGHRKLTMQQKQVLATVALSHPPDCDCDAACKPLRIDHEWRSQ